MGVVSTVGLQKSGFFEALLAPRSGMRLQTVNFPSGAEQVLMASIDFEPDEHFAKAKLLTMDRVSQFALIAARQAIAQAGLSNDFIGLEPERFGVAVGTGSVGTTSLEAAYYALLEQKAAWLRPMSVVLAMNNAIAAHLSMEFFLKGPSSTV